MKHLRPFILFTLLLATNACYLQATSTQQTPEQNFNNTSSDKSYTITVYLNRKPIVIQTDDFEDDDKISSNIIQLVFNKQSIKNKQVSDYRLGCNEQSFVRWITSKQGIYNNMQCAILPKDTTAWESEYTTPRSFNSNHTNEELKSNSPERTTTGVFASDQDNDNSNNQNNNLSFNSKENNSPKLSDINSLLLSDKKDQSEDSYETEVSSFLDEEINNNNTGDKVRDSIVLGTQKDEVRIDLMTGGNSSSNSNSSTSTPLFQATNNRYKSNTNMDEKLSNVYSIKKTKQKLLSRGLVDIENASFNVGVKTNKYKKKKNYRLKISLKPTKIKQDMVNTNLKQGNNNSMPISSRTFSATQSNNSTRSEFNINDLNNHNSFETNNSSLSSASPSTPWSFDVGKQINLSDSDLDDDEEKQEVLVTDNGNSGSSMLKNNTDDQHNDDINSDNSKPNNTNVLQAINLLSANKDKPNFK